MQLPDLRPGSHTCLLYKNQTEQLATVVPFFKEGLERRECCVYVADERTTEQVQAALQAAGVDVHRRLEQGALQLLTKYESFLLYARFDSELMIEFLDKLVNTALSQGFSALRFTGEMTWALSVGCVGLVEHEAVLNQWYPKWRVVGLCQYNMARFNPQIQRDVLRTHPFALIGDKVVENFYCEPADLFLGQKPESHRVEWMLANLKRGRRNSG